VIQKRSEFRAYEELGGLKGALATRAETEYNRLPPTVAASLKLVLRRLVSTVGGEQTFATARPAVLGSIAGDPNARALVDAFVEAQLLTADRSEIGQTIIRVVHEALLAHWPRAKELIKADREYLLWQQRIGSEVATWQRTNKDEGSLLRGALLVEAQVWLDRLGAEERQPLEQYFHEWRDLPVEHRNSAGAAGTVAAGCELFR